MIGRNVLFHLKEAIQQAKQYRTFYKAEQYREAGLQYTVLIKSLVENKSKPRQNELLLMASPEKAKQGILDILTGFHQTIKSGLTTFESLKCYEGQEQKWIDFDVEVINRSLTLNPLKIPGFVSYMKNFFSSLPEQTLKCIFDSEDFKKMQQILDCGDINSIKFITKLTKNILSDPKRARERAILFQQLLGQERYLEVGKEAGDSAFYLFA
eukprot:TRINITY_DN3427_c0_g6_i1.p1 TRINITY_DN3427_c0_g6~~TRINITY_DN3427_c0_g6_i1.p1  ORF type:complete len:211 (-),score=41.22 TRINITY_DN3427_c0_g6_i1:34-666(-)